ncbi:MAG: hypothetical protein AB8G99_00835 [Planctomycetaceae bacterium]
MRSLFGFVVVGAVFFALQDQDPFASDGPSDLDVNSPSLEPTVEAQQFAAHAVPLKRELANLHKMFDLSEHQSSRLELAIKGAVGRYQISLRKPRLMLTDRSGFVVYVRGESRALGVDVASGFVPLEPIWLKAVASTLTPDQYEQFKEEQASRLKYRREARLVAIVARFDSWLMFSATQRKEFEQLVDEEFGEALENTWGDHRVLSYFEFQILNLEVEKLQSILTENQVADMAQLLQRRWWHGDEWGNPVGGGFGGPPLNPGCGVGMGGGGQGGGGGFF